MIKKLLLSLCLSLSIILCGFSQTKTSANSTNDESAYATNNKNISVPLTSEVHKEVWKQNPYDYKVFIENRGQFDDSVKNGTVLYSVHMGRADAYFTKSGVIFSFLELAPIEQNRDPDEDGPPKRTYHHAGAEWVNSNRDVSVEAVDRESYYYTYDAGNNRTIKTYVYRKMVYHNLYPGIDAEYTFPKDNATEKRTGIKYALIIHPGADLSQVKLRYTGVTGSKIDEKGNVMWESDIKGLSDNTPVAYYEGEQGNRISVSYQVNNYEESFSLNSGYDKNKTIVIDPWTTSPAFTAPNTAYILDYDYAGNVYVYGGSGFELVKFNSAGVKQWMFTATTLASTGPYIGGMCCDKKSENCYMSEGWNSSGLGSRQEKVSTAGILLGTDPGNNNMNEMWRLVWDPCTHFVFAVGNGTCCPDQASQIDTNMVTNTVANICAPTVTANGYHDFGCLAVDPMGGSIYATCSQSLVYTTIFNNYLVKCPIPALVPATFQVADKFAVHEWSSYTFSGNLTNGYSGAAVSPAWVYLYQGDTLKQINKVTGAINAVVKVSATPYTWGGIDVDYCDDIYLGNSTSVQEYNSGLVLTATIPMTGTIYDVKVNGALLYACGVGFVSAVTITPALPQITKTRTNASCGCTGTASAQLMACGNPVAGVTYSWSNGATTSSISALCAGTYTITISPPGCASILYTDTVLIKNVGGGGPTLTTIQTNVKCNGGATGSSTVTPAGGTAPYTYAWTPVGGSNATASNLTAGTYTITVTDHNGCVSTALVIITQPPALTAAITNTPVKCNGGATGSATVTIGGGTPGYGYTWTPAGGNGSNATALTAGTYTVTVTDANGCIITASTTITQPPALTATITNTPVKCNGAATGSATVTAGGGTPGYNYSWSPSGGNGNNATALVAGSYTVTVTDANGCTITASTTITQPTALTATTTTTTATCGNPDGSATVTAGGGTPGYLYSWAPSGGNGSNATALVAGSYTVTVTDANGCTITAIANVPNAAAETVTISGSTNILCNGGNNGSITTTTTGGTPPYNYAWTPGGQTGANATGLTAGCYTVTVHDANGCTSTAGACLTEPTALTATTTTTPVLCNGGSTGSATVTANNGTPGYLYSWAPSGGNGSNATALSAGTYTVTVTDANGCSMTATATVTQPTLLTVSTGGIVNVLCNGGNNGSATTIATGGTPAYNYTWSNGQTGTNATGLIAGTYTVTATDANGCTATATATISEPSALTATTTTITSTCGKPNGSATVTVGGGTPGYVYSWSPSGGNGSNATALSTGTYTVTVTDANGCTITATANVANATAETVTISGSTNVSCNGGANGSITTNTVGGTLPYNYAWTPGGQTNANATGLTAGCYTVTVNDANGCTATASACITEPPLLTITTGAPANVLCNGNNNGSDLATATGGTGAYTYAWTTIPVQTNANATGLTAGSYTIQVTDANGCTATASTTITQPPALTLAAAGFPVTCNGGSDGQATAIPGGGTPPYAYAWSNGGTIANINSLSAGNYTITITDAHGCIYDTTVTVSQPAPIVVAFTADTINGCAPLCTGFMDASTDPGGVITHWSWSYSDGGSDTVQNPRHCFTTPGTYNVTLTVTDNHGCTSTLTIPNMITVYSAPVAAFSFGPQPTTITNPTINFTDKSTDAYGIAGWLWNFADPTNDLPGNVQNPNHTYGDTGTYCATLTVTNVHGCVDSITECLVISPQYELFIPNAFSPDGDGKNDIFQPKGQFVNNYKMYIFDRWGMLLFYTDDFTKGWNGTVNNGSNICQQDTYVYLIEVTDNLGTQHRYIGKVTLLK